MKNRKMRTVINWTMLISLVIVFVTGILLKPMPGMWLGISHGVSGFVLVITSLIHAVSHGMLGRKKS